MIPFLPNYAIQYFKKDGILPTFGNSWALTLSCLAGITLIIYLL